MDARKSDSQKTDEQLSTAKITNVLQGNNKGNNQESELTASSNDLQKQEKFVLTKSYRPAKLPTTAEIEAEYGDSYREAVRTGKIRTDGQNLRFDEDSQMWFYLSKDHPDYTGHPVSSSYNHLGLGLMVGICSYLALNDSRISIAFSAIATISSWFISNKNVLHDGKLFSQHITRDGFLNRKKETVDRRMQRIEHDIPDGYKRMTMWSPELQDFCIATVAENTPELTNEEYERYSSINPK